MKDDAAIQDMQDIADLGKDYIDEIFWPSVKKIFNASSKTGLRKVLLRDSWDGMRLLLGYFFFARVGSETAGYNYAMVDALDTIPNTKRNPSNKTVRDKVWKSFVGNCRSRRIKPFARRNKRLLNDLFALAASKGNLMKWIRRCLNQGQLDEVLMAFTDIHGVGEKIAAFAVRDLVWIFDVPESSIPPEQHIFLQPIDRWVMRRAYTLWSNLGNSTPFWVIANKIAHECPKNGISGIAFNQGAWYFGAMLGEDWVNYEE